MPSDQNYVRNVFMFRLILLIVSNGFIMFTCQLWQMSLAFRAKPVVIGLIGTMRESRRLIANGKAFSQIQKTDEG